MNPSQMNGPTRPRARVFSLTAVVTLLGAFGNLSLGWGMKHLATIVGISALPYVRAMLNPFVALGIVLLVLWVLARMALLSRADLSFVLPATAMGYILNAFLGLIFLKEAVSLLQWGGTGLIALGAALVGSDRKRAKTVHHRPDPDHSAQDRNGPD